MPRTTALLAAALLLTLTGCGTKVVAASVIPLQTATRSPLASSHPTQHLSAHSLVLTPDAGPPGTLVTMTGYVPAVSTMTPAERQKIPPVGNVQFGGVDQGLNMEAVSVIWSKTHPGDYTLKFHVPTVPWLTSHGEHALAAGRYAVTVTCVGPTIPGCALGPAQSQGAYTLTGPISVRRRAPSLHFSPDRGVPGAVIHVSGWAPLSTIIGQPFGYQLLWNPGSATSNNYPEVGLTQSMNGFISGSFQVPAGVLAGETLKTGKNFLALSYQFLRDNKSIIFAATPFTILPPKSWTSLGSFHPLSVVTNQSANTFNEPTPISVDNRMIAVATNPGTLWLRIGKRWKAVPTHPLTALAQSSGYPVLFGDAHEPAITSVTMVQGYPHSLFVAAESANKKYDDSIPPIYNTPYYSTNLGSSWKSVPVPHGYTPGDFGGYITQGHRIIAYFSTGKSWTAELSSNGGQSWSQATTLPRPTDGPALQLGPMQNGNLGQMGSGEYQTLLRLNDHGQWVTSATFSNMVGTTTLAALSSTNALLLEPAGAYPLQFTGNGGKSWTYVALPPIPGARSNSQTMGMLANGDILEQVTVNNQTQPNWLLLKPGSDVWTKIPASVMPSDIFQITINGASVWWIATNGSTTVAPTVLAVNQDRLQ